LNKKAGTLNGIFRDTSSAKSSQIKSISSSLGQG